MAERGLVIAGLSSASGKTTVTLGLLRAASRKGIAVAAAKSGPDYIDCAFLSVASGAPAVNLDCHAMSRDTVRALALAQPAPVLIIEGVMGVFDGTDGGSGSTASLAGNLGLPVLLVVDARHQAQTAAAVAAGIAAQLPAGATLAGVVLNRVASPRHLALIKAALDAQGITLFGSLPTDERISMPSRHLGLVQAGDLAADGRLDPILDNAAELVTTHLDIDAILAAADTISEAAAATELPPPPAQRIAVAADNAFGFCYTHLLDYWQRSGAQIFPFSPLADAPPDSDADFIFLPGGYPELHLPRLSTATTFLDGLRAAAARGTRIYGECGGFMALGSGIIDADGDSYPMAGLLPLETSFAARRLHLGYRHLTLQDHGLWPGLGNVTAHEFHYTSVTSQASPQQQAKALFDAKNAAGEALPSMGLVAGSVFGSYAHIIA